MESDHENGEGVGGRVGKYRVVIIIAFVGWWIHTQYTKKQQKKIYVHVEVEQNRRELLTYTH